MEPVSIKSPAINLGAMPASFAHKHNTCCDVPQLKIMLPKSVKAARGNISQIESGGAKASDARDALGKLVEFLEHLGVARLTLEWDARCQDALTQRFASRNAQAFVIMKRAFAGFAPVDIVCDGIKDNARDQPAFALERN